MHCTTLMLLSGAKPLNAVCSIRHNCRSSSTHDVLITFVAKLVLNSPLLLSPVVNLGSYYLFCCQLNYIFTANGNCLRGGCNGVALLPGKPGNFLMLFSSPRNVFENNLNSLYIFYVTSAEAPSPHQSTSVIDFSTARTLKFGRQSCIDDGGGASGYDSYWKNLASGGGAEQDDEYGAGDDDYDEDDYEEEDEEEDEEEEVDTEVAGPFAALNLESSQYGE